LPTGAREPRWHRSAPALLFAGLAAVLFFEVLTGWRVFFQRDISNFWLPLTEAFVRAVIAEGARPVWNPYLAFGQPMAADPNVQVFYPPTWLNLVMFPGRYYSLFVAFHVWFAGLGAYLLLRRWGTGPLAAFLGGAVWCASGPLVSAAGLFHHFATAAWMPWVLVALERALAEGGARPRTLLGLAAAGQALAGSADVCFMTALLAAGRTLAFLLRGRGLVRLRAVAATVLWAMTLAALLASIQWLPTLHVVKGTPRAGQAPATSQYWSLHPVGLLDLAVPRVVSDLPLTREARAAVFEDREPFLACLYLGASTIVLAALALAMPGPSRRWLLALSFVAFTWMAVGRHGGLLPLLQTVPPFSLFRFPPKYLWPAALSWGLLVGWGAAAWSRPWGDVETRRARWVFGGAALAAVLLAGVGMALHHPGFSMYALFRLVGPSETRLAGVFAAPRFLQAAAALTFVALLVRWRRRWPTAPPWLTAALVLLVVADLASVTRGANAVGPPELLTYRPALLSSIPVSSTLPPRVYAHFDLAEINRQFTRNVEGWERAPSWSLGYVDLLVPPIPSRWGVTGSFEGDPTGLGPVPLSILTQVLDDYKDGPLGRKMLRMAAVNYVTAVRPSVFGGLPLVAERQTVYESPVRLFAVPDAVPGVYVVGRSRVATEPQSYVDLQDPGFDPATEVILDGGAKLEATGFQGRSRVLWRRMDALMVATEATHPGYLVVVERHDPGWTARVDGVAAPVLRANILFRAVPVPAGQHQVELRYEAPGLLQGALLTGLGAALALAGCWWGRSGGRR
jgi:hypothetical protein